MQTQQGANRAPVQGIVFDFDGTLAELHLDFQVMKQKVAGLANAFFDTPVSPNSDPALEWIEALSAELAVIDPDAVAEFQSRCRLMITDMEIKAARRGRLFPSVLEDLKTLRDQKIKLGVITRNCTAAVRMVFPEISQRVDVFLAREDAPRVKPHPDHLLRAIQALGLHPEVCLMVGDHRIDMQTARQAGVRCAAVCTGHMSEADLRKEHPDFLAQDVQVLLQDLAAREVLWNGK